MINKLILFLIRVKLGIKKNQYFRFSNQNSNDIYFISDTGLIKCSSNYACKYKWRSSVSLNWLLSDGCEIVKCKPWA